VITSPTRSDSEIITSEFARLHGLLESASASPDSAGAPVDRVLTRLVTLRRLTGSVITLSCPPGLLAALPAATLAQVVTNLLANCARHAPGAEIHVSAASIDGVCVIEVTDAGPGLLALQGETATTGSGLGLELSSQLVGDSGGTLQLLPATRFPSGTTARLTLPLVDGVDAGTVRNDRSGDLEVAS
jgi:two-component system OmpR family sensor kinase